MRSTLTIGQVAKATGINAKTIRYYEEAGVAPPPQRSQSGYRMYSETDVISSGGLGPWIWHSQR